MKISSPVGALLSLLFIVLFNNNLSAQQRDYVALKIYTCETDQQMATVEQYLKDAYLPTLEKFRFAPVGVFKPRPKDSVQERKIYVLLPFSSMEVFEELDHELLNDPFYREKGKEYLNAPYDNPPYTRLEVVLMKAFPEMPRLRPSALTGPREERVYELRSYESATEALGSSKIKMFNDGGEIDLFDEIDANAVFYGQVVAGSHMPNLMYMTTYANMESRDKHWEEFFAAPKWKEIVDKPEYQHNVSHSDVLLLYPTEYSGY